jgi:integrase
MGVSRRHGKLRAARILKGEPNSTAKIAPLPCRFNDLRRTAVSRMLNAGVPIVEVAKIVGWSTAMMVATSTSKRQAGLGGLTCGAESNQSSYNVERPCTDV